MIQSIFLFFCRGLQIRRNFSTTCTTLGTRGEKLQADAALCGRSMVEMLGVLAIIGVLSVGAIAGYSKAMFKYKLNKQREQISQIMMSLIKYRSIFTSVNHGESIVPILIKLNALPKEMIKSTGSTSLYDNLSSSISIVRTNDDDVYFYYNMSSIADNNHTICRNILETFKEYSDVLYALGVNSDTEEEINQQDWYFGNNVHEYLKKINQLDINSMQTLCEKCDSNLCNIVAIVPSK